MKKRSLLLLLSCIMLFSLCLFGLIACGEECEHEWGDPTITIAPTCEADGEQIRVCMLCEAVESVPVSSLGHNYSTPSYNHDGGHIMICQNDNNHVITEACSFSEQVVSDDYKASDATCTMFATYYYSCKCGEKGSQTFSSGSTTEHMWDEWVFFIEPICAPGLKARACVDCEQTEVRIIPASHAYETFEGKDPTCTDIGWEEYGICVDCGHSTYVELDPIGHDKQWIIQRNPTCTQDGLKQLVCSNCNVIFDSEIIPATGHESNGTHCIHCGLAQYTIVIKYIYLDGSQAFDDTFLTLWENDNYCIISPEIENFVVDKPIISGVAETNAEILVKYEPIALQKIIYVDSIDLGNIGYNTPFSTLELPAYVIGYTETEREVRLSVSWDSSTYNPIRYGSQEISGMIIPSYGYVLDCSNEVLATLTISTNIIQEINMMDLGKLPINTTYAGLGLPSTAPVTTTDGAVYYLPVVWNEYEYDSSIAGEHIITGRITLEEGFSFAFGVENLAQISFELSERMYGTADIVFLVDTTGSMWNEIQNVKNNIVSFAEKLENEGVSVRWALLEYRDITCDGSESTKIIYCGSSEWYIDVHSYEMALTRLDVNGGGDREETVIDALKAATYLESREDAKTFYIVVTDADYKVNNNYGVSGMGEMINELVALETVTSVVTNHMFYDDYRTLTDRTNGILANIDGDFASELWRLCDLITEEVIYGDVERIEIISNPDKLDYVAGDYFDGKGMIVRAYFESGLTKDVTGYSVMPYGALQVIDTAVEINYRGKVASIEITVTAPEISVAYVSVSSNNVILTVGESELVTATVFPDDAFNKNVVWTTMNPNVAVVSNGIIEAIGVGSTEIIVTTLDGAHTVTIYVTVNPIPVLVEGIYTDIGAVELNAGESIIVNATVLPTTATNKNLTWTSTNNSVAMVSNNGEITAISGGNATIVVTTEDGGYQARIFVVVNENVGTVSGRVYSASSLSALSGVSAHLYNGSTFLQSITTGSNGSYTFNNLAYGIYEIKFEKDGFVPSSISFVVNRNSTQLDNVFLAVDSSKIPGYATGQAKNATTALGISDITIYIRSGNGNTTGTIINTLTTDSSGCYTTPALMPGNYTLQFVDNSSRTTKYKSDSINVTITGNSTSYNNDVVLSYPVVSDTMKVVLTWGASPSDLDSHLLIDGADDYHVAYFLKSAGDAVLDVDDTSSYGPETTTIKLNTNTKYTFFIHRYSSSGNSLSDSGANVKIYLGDQEYSFNVPTGNGSYWNLFTYDTATGTFTFHNTIVQNEPSL